MENIENKEFLETFWECFITQNCNDAFELRCFIGRMVGVLQGLEDNFTDAQKKRIEKLFIQYSTALVHNCTDKDKGIYINNSIQ